MSAVFEKSALHPNTALGVWVALYSFTIDGQDWDVMHNVGSLEQLTAADARAIMDVRDYLGKSRLKFLEAVPLQTKH